jgi:hypothetical protein
LPLEACIWYEPKRKKDGATRQTIAPGSSFALPLVQLKITWIAYSHLSLFPLLFMTKLVENYLTELGHSNEK